MIDLDYRQRPEPEAPQDRTEPPRMLTCPRCAGTGGPERKCSACHGSGQITEDDLPLPPAPPVEPDDRPMTEWTTAELATEANLLEREIAEHQRRQARAEKHLAEARAELAKR